MEPLQRFCQGTAFRPKQPSLNRKAEKQTSHPYAANDRKRERCGAVRSAWRVFEHKFSGHLDTRFLRTFCFGQREFARGVLSKGSVTQWLGGGLNGTLARTGFRKLQKLREPGNTELLNEKESGASYKLKTRTLKLKHKLSHLCGVELGTSIIQAQIRAKHFTKPQASKSPKPESIPLLGKQRFARDSPQSRPTHAYWATDVVKRRISQTKNKSRPDARPGLHDECFKSSLAAAQSELGLQINSCVQILKH